MKSKNDLFSEKMPSSLKSQILASANEHLEKNTAQDRKSILNWILGAGLAAATASISFILVRQNSTADNQQAEMAQSVELFEDIQSEEDFELVAELELFENLDLIDQFDDEA